MKQRDPSPDELLAMAYVDGELGSEQRQAFEERLRQEPQLLREVAEQNGLAVLARQVTPPEPMDFEWQRLEQETLHGSGLTLGLLLSAVGALGLILWGMFEILIGELPVMLKLLFLLLLGGMSGVFLLILRARLQTQHLDPYTKVQR